MTSSSNNFWSGLDLGPDEEYSADYLPTRDLPAPPPNGRGTKSLCERCLTLLYQVVLEFGRGGQLYRSALAHSIFRLNPVRADYSPEPPDGHTRLDGFVKRWYEPQTCVICRNIKTLFDTDQRCGTSDADVRITWTLHAVDPKVCFNTKFPLSKIEVRIEAKQYREYSVTLGSFDLWNDDAVDINGVVVQDTPVIVPLDHLPVESTTTATPHPGPEFVSTCGLSTRRMIASWMRECLETHPNCAHPRNVHPSTPKLFVPGRLIHLTEEVLPNGNGIIHARIVEKSVPSDFPVSLSDHTIRYLSVSHCWGPPPDPNAHLEGRAKSVLTLANHSEWRTSIPTDDISTTAVHAIQLCWSFGFEYIWIDSLCIIQDSVEDWRRESATMGDIYQFAWCNLAAMWSRSDSDGFLNFKRDPRVDFGFHASLSDILGIDDPASVRNKRGEECTLLRGRARLIWNFGHHHGTAPLLTRAWVFQERHLARRTLAFTDKAVYWSCPSVSRCENDRWHARDHVSPALREWQTRVALINLTKRRVAESTTDGGATERMLDAQLTQETAKFWTGCVSAYTDCKLTKPTDRLIALSSIAKEVSAAGQMSKAEYLAGLWNLHLENQLLWCCTKPSAPEGQRVYVPPRRRRGDAQYTAPTWSWASVEQPVGPGSILSDSTTRQLAFVRDAHVSLATDFEWGLVTAGYIRMSGRLLPIGPTMGFNSPNNPWILDGATSRRINFGFDTSEDIDSVRHEPFKVRWVPVRMNFSERDISCAGLIVLKTDEYKKGNSGDGGGGDDGDFVRPGDKVYRRLGHAYFGRTLEVIGQDPGNDPLVLRELGCDWKGEGATFEQYLKSFRLREDGFEEFVLI